MSRPKNSFEPYKNSKKSQLEAKKSKTTPKVSQYHKGNIENKSFSTTWVDWKTVLNQTMTLKLAHLDLKKTETTPKFCQKQKLWLK